MSSSSVCPEISSLNVVDLRAHYASRRLSPVDVVRHVYDRIRSYQERDPAVWIHLIPQSTAVMRAEELVATYYSSDDRPLPSLFGIPFSVKNSIDVKGLPTTLACSTFSYTPEETAPVVSRILAAGGILIGATNLDQFATGLTGVRSPYGIPRCVFDADYVSGGSSSGSAVSVAASLVSFTVCTDTGGSTRVPAAYNGLVGLKPTLGTISTVGLVPACKNIDCVCMMARTMDDAEQVWDVMRAFDERDVYARRELPVWSPWKDPIRFAIPPEDLLHDMSPAYAELFQNVVTALRSRSDWCVEAEGFDYAPFGAANQMLYDSSIVSQRLLAFEGYIKTWGLEHLHPAIQTTFRQAMDNRFSAERAYDDIFTLAGHRRQAEMQFRDHIDVLVVPSTIDHPTVAQLAEEPMARNKVLGRFTNFVNLLDLAAVSVPAGWWLNPGGKKMPFGVTVVGQAGKDRELMAFGQEVVRMMAAATEV
ncbi:allophanate hydrolase [Fonsecaea erecta]|uniref:Allophanate hydrolase n=1 Tax=Fonsecaea erecta TaxID=1367422 RepID=A0A178ZBN0_9EURO|nr:allophanate hydrolase [Fonsecaea erecta]OAP57194.1 allophanate hydrolase [Fonsecaea erecta]